MAGVNQWGPWYDNVGTSSINPWGFPIPGVDNPYNNPASANMPVASSFSMQNISSSGQLGFGPALNTIILATAGVLGITITLPSAVGSRGQFIILKKIDNSVGVVTVTTNPPDVIDSADFGSSYQLTNWNQYVTLVSDGLNWYICASD